MENNTQPTNESVIPQVLEKLKNVTIKAGRFISKRVGPLLLTIYMGFSLTSCNFNDTDLDSNQPDSSINDSANLDSSTGSNSSTDSSVDTSIGGDPTEDKYELSDILKTVLYDDYYNGLIKKGKDLDNNGAVISSKSQAYQAVPYGFLEDQGYDIEAIKNNELFCQSDIYVINNHLYIEVRAEKTSPSGCCGNYLIRYLLTDKELTELDTLFSSLNHHTKATYYQAPFFVQELSYQKDPEIISEAYITEDALELTEINLGKKNFASKTASALYMGRTYNEEEYLSKYTFQIHKSTIQGYGEKPKTSFQVAQITFTAYGPGSATTINGKSFFEEEVYDITSGLLADDKQNFEESKTYVTSYSSHNAIFEDILESEELNNMFSNNK